MPFAHVLTYMAIFCLFTYIKRNGRELFCWIEAIQRRITKKITLSPPSYLYKADKTSQRNSLNIDLCLSHSEYM